MANAGRILILPKGEYNANTTYSMLDLVTYNGASWVCKKTAVGIAPSDANSEYWQKMIDVAGKQDKIKGGATSITNDNLTVNRALVSDANGKVAVSAVTATELGYLDGATGNIQTQLDNKSDEDHTHNPPSLADCGGILPLEKGGTGSNNAKEAEYNILSGMTESNATMTDNGQIVFAYTSPSKTGGRLYWRKASVLWDYIKSKMGDIDSASVRYVSDESDANFDWIQVKDANGEWINIQRAYTQRYELYMNHINNAEFKSSAITVLSGTHYVCYEPTITQTENGLYMYVGNKAVGQYACGCVISKAIDLSRFNTLKFNHTSLGSGNGASGETYAFLFISNSNKSGSSPLVRYDLFNHYNNNNQSGEVTIDISALSGECYIGLELHGFSQNTAYVTIDDMYIE